MAEKPLTTGFSLEELGEGSTVSKNVGQDVIVTTRDRIELCLIHHQKNLRSRQDWLIPLGILVPIILALTTTAFKPKTLGLDGDTWQAVFVLGCFIASVWLVVTGMRAMKSSDTAIETIISHMKTPPAPLTPASPAPPSKLAG